MTQAFFSPQICMSLQPIDLDLQLLNQQVAVEKPAGAKDHPSGRSVLRNLELQPDRPSVGTRLSVT
jgi:hypothetical protein